ncbi:MAG: transporter substrate-binding domain-containing protein [Proteobacteria bacterium]|nr:transporter substrate-binding domain-containing protein [Pseudomonadota bacterium]
MRSKPCLVVLVCLIPASVLAQSAQPSSLPDQTTPEPAALRVGISPFVPFVFLGGTEPEGFSIDLWRRVAVKLGQEYRFVESSGVAEKLGQLQAGEIDVAIGGITMTREREELVDFTHPSIESGLAIMVRAGEHRELGYFTRLNLGKGKWGIIIAFIVLIIVAGHLMWLAERGRDAFHDKYVPGVFEGMYWAIVTASTVGYGDKAPVRWPGRIVAMLAIIVALPMFALFTAELASTITVAEFESRIRGPQDLARHRVGVVRGTASATWSANQGLLIYQWDGVDEVYQALDQGVVDAIVYDAPNLQYYAQNRGRGKVELASEPFLLQDLGIAVREGSRFRERINRALLELVESGEMQQLRIRWFGKAEL